MPALLAITGLLVLPVMAASSPPDPAWIDGIYDGGDGDDAVALVTETTAATNGDLYLPLPLMNLFQDTACPAPRGHRTERALVTQRGPPPALRDPGRQAVSRQTPAGSVLPCDRFLPQLAADVSPNAVPCSCTIQPIQMLFDRK